MKTLDLRALALAAGLLWGGALLFVGLVAMFVDGYGLAFREVMASIYPMYDGAATWGSTLLGGVAGFVDGAVCGALLAWLYGLFHSRKS